MRVQRALGDLGLGLGLRLGWWELGEGRGGRGLGAIGEGGGRGGLVWGGVGGAGAAVVARAVVLEAVGRAVLAVARLALVGRQVHRVPVLQVLAKTRALQELVAVRALQATAALCNEKKT